MSNRKFLFIVLIGTGVFIYLIGSFLIATFNITLWQDGQRFLAVLIYLLIVGSSFNSLVEPPKNSAPKQKIVEKEIEQKKVV